MRRGRGVDDTAQPDGHFANYADYSRTLRAWLVAYGIGGPVLFISNAALTKKVSESGFANGIVIAFLVGVALQVFLALVNKWSAWHMYAGAHDESFQTKLRYKFWEFINDQSWIDFWVDVMSMVAFVWATWRVLNVFLAPAAA